MAEPDPTKGASADLRLAYLMTHYPRVALTFIAGEIDEIERLGGCVLPIAMNSPTPADVATADAQDRRQKTMYLKASSCRLAGALMATVAARPMKTARLMGIAVKSARWDLSLILRRLAHLSYAAAVARECRAQGIGHLHAQFGLAPATIAWFACDILNFEGGRKATWSFTIHGFQDFADEPAARLDLKAASANFVVCVSDFTRSQLCRVSDPRYWRRFRVVRCGINLATFPLRRARPLSNVPRIVVVGRLSPEKGHAILLDAVKKLADEGVVVELDVIGDGPFGDALRRQEAALGIDRCVTHSGELLPAEVSRRLADADMFCLPSFSEGLPISIMEAMAVGVPVITTWIGGIPELAVHEVTALTVPPGNSDALSAAIKRMISDEGLRARLIQEGRAAVERMHSLGANVRQLAKMFQAVAKSEVRA